MYYKTEMEPNELANKLGERYDIGATEAELLDYLAELALTDKGAADCRSAMMQSALSDGDWIERYIKEKRTQY